METATILSHVDHTLLKPEATWDQIKTLCDEAMEFGWRHSVYPAVLC